MTMNKTTKMDNIIQKIEELDYISKIDVMSRIISMLKKTQNASPSRSLTEIKGLGKEVWQDINVESYISKEREAWKNLSNIK